MHGTSRLDGAAINSSSALRSPTLGVTELQVQEARQRYVPAVAA